MTVFVVKNYLHIALYNVHRTCTPILTTGTQKMYNEHTDSLPGVSIGHPMHYIQCAE
jgi:hypothetical protein